MIYTCAYFPTPESSLEQAQIAKMDLVCRKMNLKSGERVIEFGCGWGSLAIFMAKRYGASVTALNISSEQIAYARRRAKVEGLSGQVRFVEDDYRNAQGRYDVFISVGMLEHVGLADFATLGQTVARCLEAHGRGLLHFIGRNQPALLNPWIRKRIFPGAYPPTLREVFERVIEPNAFSVLDVENLRLHYAKTLEHWRSRFDRASAQVDRMFDERFVRAWRLYLAGSEAAFSTGSMQLFQVLFAPGTSNAIAGRDRPPGDVSGAVRRAHRRRRACGLVVRVATSSTRTRRDDHGPACVPRDKVCAGWITPQVIDDVELDCGDYRRGRTFQAVIGFRTGIIGSREAIYTRYERPVSYGIRRCEFDQYLLERSGSRVRLAEPASTFRRVGAGWIVNESIETRMLVGAGGHFCPVARWLNPRVERLPLVVAQEAEFPIDAADVSWTTAAGVPELYFRRDLSGYGWCFRKEPYINIGFGLLGPGSLPKATAEFVEFLRTARLIPSSGSLRWRGHAYLVSHAPRRRAVDDAVILIGDAAGVAYPQSGEGIRPAIESGLIAAAAIAQAAGRYSYDRLARTSAACANGSGARTVDAPCREPSCRRLQPVCCRGC